MQKAYVVGIAFVVCIGTAIEVFVFMALEPYKGPIGSAMALFVIVVIFCGIFVAIFGTYFFLRWLNLRSSTIVSGELVAHQRQDGMWDHLSAQHWQAKQPTMLPEFKEDTFQDNKVTDENILEAYSHGASVTDIAKRLQVRTDYVCDILQERNML